MQNTGLLRFPQQNNTLPRILRRWKLAGRAARRRSSDLPADQAMSISKNFGVGTMRSIDNRSATTIGSIASVLWRVVQTSPNACFPPNPLWSSPGRTGGLGGSLVADDILRARHLRRLSGAVRNGRHVRRSRHVGACVGRQTVRPVPWTALPV